MLCQFGRASCQDRPVPSVTNRQKSWDQPSVQHIFDTLLVLCTDDTSRSWLIGAGSPESCAWLKAPPVSSLGLRMSNDTIRTALGLKVVAPVSLPLSCSSCGEHVDVNMFSTGAAGKRKTGLNGRSCRSNQGRIPRHQMLNYIIHHSLASANIPSRLAPSDIYRADGNRPDGVTVSHWSKGKFLVWDGICVDTSALLTKAHHPRKQEGLQPTLRGGR